MKILMLTPYLPYPPSSGGQIRSYNLIKQLSKKHQITLCSLIKYDSDAEYVKDLAPFCDKVYIFKRPAKPWTISNIWRTGTSSWPFLVIRNFSASEKAALPKIITEGDFDIIHAETFYVSPHIPKTNIPMVLVDQTIEYRVYQHYVDNFKLPFLKPLLQLDVMKLKHWETFYWKKAAKVVAVSDKDATIMEQVVGKNKVSVIPNGVGEDLMTDTPLHYSQTIFFSGNYLWLQNSEAAEILAKQVFPLIQKQLPKAKLVIAGQNIEKIAHLKSDNIELKDLGDDIEEVKLAFKTSGVLVAPLYGPGGTRLKILGAMASRLPVVTTKVGVAGLEVENGKSVMFGDTVEELAGLTVQLLNDKKLYKKIADNARQLVQKHYAYPAIAEELTKVYEQVIKK